MSDAIPKKSRRSASTLKPVDLSAIAIWFWHIAREERSLLDGFPRRKQQPQDYLERAYDLLAEAQKVLERAATEQPNQ